MASIEAPLAAAAQTVAVGDRIDAYEAILKGVLEAPPPDWRAALEAYVRGAVLERVNIAGAGLIVGRRCLQLLCDSVRDAHTDASNVLSDIDAYLWTLRMILEATHDQAVALEDELSEVRTLLADQLEQQAQWADAAQALQGIVADTNRRSKSDEYWLRVNVRLLRLFLRADDGASADLYLKKSSSLLHSVQREHAHEAADLILEYRKCQAEVYDRQLRCYEAASRYYELSTLPALPESEQADVLTRSVAAAILAQVSAQRQRLLAQLLRDPRTADLALGPALRRVADRRIVRGDMLELLRSNLAAHQLQKRGTSESVLDEAIVEHNIYAASRVYSAITIASLAELVQRTPDECEAIVARMIMQKRLPTSCWIHQVAGAVYFAPEDELEADIDDDAPSQAIQVPAADADEAQRQCRDRRIGAALAYLSDAHAMLRKTAC